MRVAGIVLTVVLYSVVVLLAVVLLAAVQLRSSGGALFDTWKLNYDANKVVGDEQKRALRALQDHFKQNMDYLNWAKLCLRLYDQAGLLQTKRIDPETLQDIKKARHDRTPLANLSGDVKCAVQGFTSLKYDETYYEMLTKDDSLEIEDLKKSLASNGEQYADLIKGHQDFIAFRSMASTWYLRPFFDSPYDLLVLLLVMMMGAIGGVVRLLRDYGSSLHTDPSPRDYVFVPLIGMVVAIGGYVLAKTGLLLLSSTKEETSLSPYMISLVGIISGLLAREVIEAIAASGRGIIKRSATPPRHKDGGNPEGVG